VVTGMLAVAIWKLRLGNRWTVGQNLEQNPRHYSSWLAWFGGRAVCEELSIFYLLKWREDFLEADTIDQLLDMLYDLSNFELLDAA